MEIPVCIKTNGGKILKRIVDVKTDNRNNTVSCINTTSETKSISIQSIIAGSTVIELTTKEQTSALCKVFVSSKRVVKVKWIDGSDTLEKFDLETQYEAFMKVNKKEIKKVFPMTENELREQGIMRDLFN